jgi:hypothetical protein
MAKSGNRLFLFKVVQSNHSVKVRGFPYRVIAVPETFTLYELAMEILARFEFECDHAFGFYNNIVRYGQSNEGYELFSDDEMGSDSDFPGVKETPVTTVFTTIGKKMLFLFDYGDEWHFIVKLIGIKPANDGELCAVCVKSIGKARHQYEGQAEIEMMARIDEDDEEYNHHSCG